MAFINADRRRLLQYFWLKRVNILMGLAAITPLSLLVAMWLVIWLSDGDQYSVFEHWPSGGVFAVPIALSVLFFIVGVLALGFVFTRADFNEVFPKCDAKTEPAQERKARLDGQYSQVRGKND